MNSFLGVNIKNPSKESRNTAEKNTELFQQSALISWPVAKNFLYSQLRGVLFVCGATAQRGPGPPHTRGFYITHSDTPESVGLLCTRDRPVAETFTWQHTTLTRDSHPWPQRDFFILSLYFYLHCFVLFVLALPFVLTVQHTTQTSMPPAGFEPATAAGERLQTHALDRSATGINCAEYNVWIITKVF